MPRPTIGKQVRYFTAAGKERPAFLLAWDDSNGEATVSVLHHPAEDGQRGGHVYEAVPFFEEGDGRESTWDWREEDVLEDGGRAGKVYAPPATPPSSASSSSSPPATPPTDDKKSDKKGDKK